MRPITTTLTYAYAVTTGVSLLAVPSATNALINGTYATAGVATLPVAANVTLTSVSNLSTIAITVTGTTAAGAALVEVINGPNNNTVTTTGTFKTVTSIAGNFSALVAETLSAGAATAGDSGTTAWWPLDIYNPNQVTTISATLTGTGTYSVKYTNEDPFDASITQTAVAHPVAAFTSATASQTGTTTTLMRAVCLNVAAGVGSLRVTVTQQSTA